MIAIEFSGQPPEHKMLRAGYEAERKLAFYLNRAFRDEAYEYRVFHGIRIQRGEDVAQVDHLVLHRFGFFIVESKSIVDSIRVNEHGEFTRWFRNRSQGMPSPIAQARRQADLLQRLLNDRKEKLRRIVGIGPLKQQGEFGEQRFRLIAAISDKGQIKCSGDRPPELMKAEAVVEHIQGHVAKQHSLASAKGVARSLLHEFTNRQKAREWDENHIIPFTDHEIDAITDFLVESHTPRTGSSVQREKPAAARTSKPIDAAPSLSMPQSASPQRPVKPAASATATMPSSSCKGPERNMARWTAPEEDRLREAFAAGRCPEEIAKSFGRTAKALRLRAEKLGLVTNAADWK